MTNSVSRGIAAELAIALMVCGAAYGFVIRPMEARVGAMRARAEAMIAQGVGASSAGAVTIDELERAAEDIRRTAHELHGRGRDALDEAGMFAALADLARTHELRLEQLQPSAGRMPPPKPAADGAPPPADRAVGYTLTVRGEFSNVATFLRELPRRFANSAVLGARISAAVDPQEPAVTAIVTTNHWVFDAMPAVRLADAALAQQGGED